MSSVKIGIELVSLNANAAIADLNKYTQSLTSLDQAGSKASDSLESSMGTVDKSTGKAMKSAEKSTDGLGKNLDSLGSTAEGAGDTVSGAFSDIESGSGDIESTGESVEGLGTSMEDAAKSGEEFGSGIESGIDPLGDLESGTQDAADGTESLADVSEAAAGSVEDMGSSVEDAAGTAEDFGSGMESVGSSVEDMGSSVDGSVSSIEDLGDAASDASSGNDDLGSSSKDASGSIKEQGSAVKSTSSGLGSFEKTLSDSAKSTEDFGGAVEESVSPLEDLSDGSETAAEGTETLSSASETAADALGTEGSEAGNVSGELESLGDGAETAAEGTETLSSASETAADALSTEGSEAGTASGELGTLGSEAETAAGGTETLSDATETATTSLTDVGAEAGTATQGIEELGTGFDTASTSTTDFSTATTDTVTPLTDMNTQLTEATVNSDDMTMATTEATTELQSENLALTDSNDTLGLYNTSLLDTVTNTTDLTTGLTEELVPLQEQEMLMPTLVENQELFNTAQEDAKTVLDENVTSLEDNVTGLEDLDDVSLKTTESVTDFGDQTEIAKDQTDQFKDASDNAAKGQTSMKGSLVSVGSSMASLGSSIVNLWQSYDSLGDAQLKVDKASLKLSNAQEALSKIQTKLNLLTAEGKQGTPEYAAALLDMEQAQQKVAVAEGTVTNAQEDLNTTSAQFYQTIIPNIIGVLAGASGTFMNLAGENGLLRQFSAKMGTVGASSFTATGIITALSGEFGVFRKGTLDATDGLHGMDKGMKLISLTNPFFIAMTIGAAFLGVFVTNAFGVTDAINGIGNALGEAVPILKPFLIMIGDLGGALVSLFSFGQTESKAFATEVTGNTGQVETASKTMGEQWYQTALSMSTSNDKMTSDIGNAVINIKSAHEQMTSHFVSQIHASVATWGQFVGALSNGDVEGAVDIMLQAFSHIPSIVMTAANDAIHYFGTIAESIGQLTLNTLGIFAGWGQTLVSFFSVLGGKLVAAALPMLDGLLEKLGLKAFGQSVLTFVHEAVNVINAIPSMVTVTAQAIWDQIIRGFAGISDWVTQNITTPLNNWISGISNTVQHAWNTIIGKIGDVGKWAIDYIGTPLNKWISGVTETVQNVWNTVIGKIGDVGNWAVQNIGVPLNKWISGVKETVQNAWNTIIGKIGDVGKWAIDNIGTPLNKWVSGVTQTVQVAWNTVIGKIGDVGKWALDNIGKPLNNWTGGVTATVQQVWNSTIGKIGDVGKWAVDNIGKPINNWASGVTTTVQSVWNSTIGVLGDVANWVKTKITDHFNNWVNNVTVTAQTVWNKMGMDGMLRFVTNLVKDIGEIIMSIPNQLRNIFSIIWNKLGFGLFTSKFTEVGKSAIDALMAIPNGIVGIGASIWKQLFGDFDLIGEAGKLGKGIVDTLGGYVNTLGEAFAGMQKALGDAFKLPTAQGQETDKGGYDPEGDYQDQTDQVTGGNNITQVSTALDKVTTSAKTAQQALIDHMNTVAQNSEVYRGLADSLKKTVTEYGGMHSVLNSTIGIALLETQGTMSRMKAYQDLQVQLVQNRASNQQYYQDVMSGNALNIAYATGVEAQKKALLDQAVALATSAGKHAELTNQMTQGLPQLLAYHEGVMAQKEALTKMQLEAFNTQGRISELSSQLATGEMQQAQYTAGVLETILAFGEQQAALSKTTGEIDAYNVAIRMGIAQDIAYAQGQQEIMRSVQDNEIALSKTKGELDMYNQLVTIGIPQNHAYAQSQFEVQRAATGLIVEFASLTGTADAMFESFGKSNDVMARQTTGFAEGRKSAAEWGYQLEQSAYQNDGLISGLFELADAMGSTVPDGVKHTEESLKAYIAVTENVPSHIQEVAKKMYDAGLGMAQELASGLAKGGEESDKAIETLQNKIGVEMPDDLLHAIESAGIGQNMLDSLRTSLELGSTGFDNIPVDRIQYYTSGLANKLLMGLGEMDASSRAMVEGTMNEISTLLKKGPENNTPEGIQKFLAELDALMLKAQAQADPTSQKLTQVASVKADPSTWISLDTALADGRFSADELAGGIQGISTATGGVTPSIDSLNAALATGKITNDQYTQAVAALKGAVDPASESLTGAKQPTDHLGEAFVTSGQKLAAFVEVLKMLPEGVTYTVGLMNTEWAKQDPLPPAVAQKMMVLGQVLVQVPLDVTTAVTNSNTQFALLNPMQPVVVTGFTNLGIAIANVPVQFTTAFNTVQANVAGVMSNLATTTFTQFFANMGTMVANIPVQWTQAFNTVYSNVQGVMNMMSSYMTTWFTTHGSSLQQAVPVSWTTAFNTVYSNVMGVMSALANYMNTWFQTHKTALATIPVSWTQAYNTATQNAAGAISLFQQHLIRFFTGMNQSLAQVPVWFTLAYNRGTQNASGMVNQLFQVHTRFFTELNRALGQVPSWFTASFNRGTLNAAGMINQLFRVATHFFTELHRATGQVPSWFTAAFSRATQNAAGMITSLVRHTQSAMSVIQQAAERAASGLQAIGNAASSVISQVDRLRNSLDALPNITRTITYTIRTVGTLPAGAGSLEEGTVGAVGIHRRSDAIVGENGKEIVQLSNIGIDGRVRDEKTFVTKGVTRVDYTDKMLTVVPLQGRNAERFAAENPMFRSLQEGVNSGLVRFEGGTAYNTDGVYEKGFVKKGGWGANTDPRSWRVTKMKDNPKLWKVVDRTGDNVATNFSSEKTAGWYIGDRKRHDAGRVLHNGWGANQDPDSWSVTKMRDNPKLWKIVDANMINVVTDFANKLAAETYILKKKGKLGTKPPTGGGGGNEPPTKPPTIREVSLAARMERPDLGNAVPDYQRDQTGTNFTMPADPSAREFGFNAGAYELGKSITSTPAGAVIQPPTLSPPVRGGGGTGGGNGGNGGGTDHTWHINRLYQMMQQLIDTLLSKNLSGNALWQDQSRIVSRNVGDYL